MVVTNHSQQLTSTGEIFLDRDPKLFEYIARFLISGECPAPDTKLQKEFEYFKIPFPIKSALLEGSDFANNIVQWLPNRKFQLLYKASADGFASEDFHKKCDNKGATLTLILSSNGFLFGGYSVLSWDSIISYKNHSEGFIFTLSNPHNLSPTIYFRNLQNPRSIYCNSSLGPTFGSGKDIYIPNNPHKNKGHSYFTGDGSYLDSTGKGENTFTGEYQFFVSDIEVFSVL